MMNSDVPQRLKALREASGLSIRALADRLNMSSSGYSHYETPARFKDQFLPMQIAMNLAEVLGPLGVSRDKILALAGSFSGPQPEPDVTGFSEDAARPWSASGDRKHDVDAAIRAIAPTALRPSTYQMAMPIPEMGFLKGDIIIIDTKRLPDPGEMTLGNAITENGWGVTVIGRYLPPLLFTAESLTKGTVIDTTKGNVSIFHPIVGCFRSITIDERA